MKMPANTFKPTQKCFVFLLLILSGCTTIGGIVLLLLVLSGCASMGSSNGFDGVSASHPSATEPIARDAARLMAGFYPPGHTSLHVNPAAGFGQAFDGALRQRGFTMSESGIPVKYQLDMLDASLCYLSLRTPGNVITQSYILSGGSIVSGSTVTVTDGMSFTEPMEPSYLESNLPPEPVQDKRGLQLVLIAPPIESLKSGITRDVTMTVMENGRVVPGANLRFHHSAGYPNLRTIDRFAENNGRLTLRSLIIQDINQPLTASVYGQEVKLHLNGATHSDPIKPASVPATPIATAATRNPAPPLPPQNEFATILAEIGGETQTEPVKPAPKPAPVQPVKPVSSSALPYQNNKPVPAQSVSTAAAATPNLAPVPPANGTSSTGPVESDLPPEPVRIEETWKIEHGLLREQLIRWADKAGYQVVWKASSDYDIYTSATFRGSFDIAVEELFTRLHAHGNALRVGIYKANKVIEVNED